MGVKSAVDSCKEITSSFVNNSNKIDNGESKDFKINHNLILILPYNGDKKLLVRVFNQYKNELKKFYLNKDDVPIAYVGAKPNWKSVLVQQFNANGEKLDIKEFLKDKDCKSLSRLFINTTTINEGSGSIRLEALGDNKLRVTNTGKNPIYYRN